jgi:hypothetical protein
MLKGDNLRNIASVLFAVGIAPSGAKAFHHLEDHRPNHRANHRVADR